MKNIGMLPEVFVSNKDMASTVGRMVKNGKARKIGPALYTRNMVDPPDTIVRRNLWPIVGLLVPGAGPGCSFRRSIATNTLPG